MSTPRFTIEEVTDPEEIARSRALRERARRNDDWLQAHWPEIAPRARGRFLAVAGQEAFIADSMEEAWAMALAAHPDDDGAHLQYVIAKRGPRIYAHRGYAVPLRRRHVLAQCLACTAVARTANGTRNTAFGVSAAMPGPHLDRYTNGAAPQLRSEAR